MGLRAKLIILKLITFNQGVAKCTLINPKLNLNLTPKPKFTLKPDLLNREN